MIRIFIIDDHQLFIDGLKMILNQIDGFEVVGQALSGEEGIAALGRTQTDILITDYSMGGMSGYEVVKYVRKTFPKIRIITLTMHAEIEYIDKMINAGSLGYLMKNTGRKELKVAIETVYNGESFYSKMAKDAILNKYTKSQKPKEEVKKKPTGIPVRFTPREKEVLKMMVMGLPSKEIADALCLSYHTVTTHRSNIHSKIASSSDLTLTQYVKAYGVLDE